jgi:uncharacterized membrane protein YfcA
VTAALIIACCGLLVASSVQAATGFGFALVAGPALYAVTTPASAVLLVMAIGQVVNLLVLFGERRALEIDWGAVRPCLIAALPGLPVGAFLLTVVPASAMRLGVGVAVCALVLVRLIHRRRAAPVRPVGREAAVLAGFTVGVLTTSTTTSGPPLAIWLTARRMPAAAIRDAVTVIFFALDTVGIALVVSLAPSASLARAAWIPVLAPIAILGHFIGHRAFLRLPERHYPTIVLTSAFTAGCLAILTAVTGQV